ncbi:MAG: hypothetical protein OXH99_09020 [Bryobacterales bacterium]|nr:hypothetical protein [Bryobacterales bacterium]
MRRLEGIGIHASWSARRQLLLRWARQTTRLQAEDGSWIETDHNTCPDTRVAPVEAALGHPGRLQRQRLRILVRAAGKASELLFGDLPSIGKKKLCGGMTEATHSAVYPHPASERTHYVAKLASISRRARSRT